ncbi:hypothetical protein [Microlunatus antarcticus]|uniref:Peptidase MA superfamily protein n=1 Tax=Microlunatus antarcticus TaxID=53388 RepID=A0A7W5JXX7_9ACTN|nr:hypothetical protein [Microlunatus antarcticus]MBB3328334.1 hypothetical protein [Microlunatus antarcticus]
MIARRTSAGFLAVVLALGVGACSPPRSSPTVPATAPSTAAAAPTTGSSRPATPDAQTALDRLFAAGRAGDRTGWDAGTAPVAGFAGRSTLLFDNLVALRPTRLRVRLTGAEQDLPTDRRAELGAEARVVQASVGWRLAGERADATSSVWLTLVPGPDGVRLAGTDDGSTLDSPAVPIWWLAPVTRVTRGDVTVLVGPGQDAPRWAALATRAAADAHDHLPAVLRRDWDGGLVVEVPGSGDDFARVLGGAPSAYATTAAVTRPEGPTTASAVRVVVNPATARDPEAELGTTLTHETVHVATSSATSAAPLWAVEGLAEHVALEAHPDQRRSELAVLPGGAPPTRLPADAAFTAGGPEVTAAYAQAWLVCLAVAEHRGDEDLGRFYRALDGGATVSAAARSTLGVDEATVVRWWRGASERAAADRRG